MNKTEKEYYSKCTKKTRFPYGGERPSIYPVCVYYNTEKGRCELNYCYRQKGGLLNRGRGMKNE